jgi:glycine oxidase
MVGATGVAGLVVATGHYRNGILLAPLTAQEVVRVLSVGTETAGSTADGPFGPFGPGRFAGGASAAPTRLVPDVSGIPG